MSAQTMMNNSKSTSSPNSGSRGVIVSSGLFGSFGSVSTGSGSGFLHLFEKQKWRAIRKKLRSKKVMQFIRNIGSEGISSLSLALGHNAPVDIVETMLEIDAGLALQTDFLGATPLHVACLNGSNLTSIKMLVEKYPSLVTKRDKDHRIPLHHAVEFICRLERASDDVVSNGIEVIKQILTMCPESVHYADKEGDSPLDLAHVVMMETDTSFEDDASTFSRVEFTYKLLKKVSIDVYLQRKRQWEEKGYDTSLKKANTISLGEESGETQSESHDSSRNDGSRNNETLTHCT